MDSMNLATPTGRQLLALRANGRGQEADALLPALHARCAAILQQPEALTMLMDRMATHLIHGRANTRILNQTERAATFLDRVLPHGPRRRDALVAEAEHQGISLAALYRASKGRVSRRRCNNAVWWAA